MILIEKRKLNIKINEKTQINVSTYLLMFNNDGHNLRYYTSFIFHYYRNND